MHRRRRRPTALAVLTDIRTGLPGGADEANGGDAAVAVLFGEGEVIAETIGGAGATGEFLDRWRTPGGVASRQWEERFGEHAYVPLAEQAVNDALKSAGLDGGRPRPRHRGRLCTAGRRGPWPRPSAPGPRPTSTTSPRSSATPVLAQAALLLADVLDRAEPGQTIALVQLADGADAWLLRTTDAVVARRPSPTVRRADRGHP